MKSMIELEEEILEDTDPYESEGSEDDEAGSDEFAGLTRENYVDRVRFDRVPSESRSGRGEDAGSTSSADPLYIYYRSMSKIPLLTREEEVYLAKKIETAKLNILRLLSLTPVFTRLLLEDPEEVQPAPPQAPQGGAVEPREP